MKRAYTPPPRTFPARRKTPTQLRIELLEEENAHLRSELDRIKDGTCLYCGNPAHIVTEKAA